MKKQLKMFISVIVIIIVTSCSKDDDKVTEPSIVGKWEFSKEVTYNESNQEALVDYTHRCETKKDYMQFESNANYKDSHSTYNCQSEENTFTYVFENGMVKLYSNGVALSYAIKVKSLTNNELRIKYENSSPTGKAYIDEFILVRK
ncbi:lipocalin family protein [Flavobacterium sp.]|uniref:lipocalin family protein n=1 Tax=Flavobacterium sp. TaxID=239 RepID=UPI0035B397ED